MGSGPSKATCAVTRRALLGVENAPLIVQACGRHRLAYVWGIVLVLTASLFMGTSPRVLTLMKIFRAKTFMCQHGFQLFQCCLACCTRLVLAESTWRCGKLKSLSTSSVAWRRRNTCSIAWETTGPPKGFWGRQHLRAFWRAPIFWGLSYAPTVEICRIFLAPKFMSVSHAAVDFISSHASLK